MELAGDRSARIGGRRSIRDLERTPNPLDLIRRPEFLSLFKGQGAAVRGDDRVVNVRHGTHRGGRLAQLVRALP